MESEERKRKIDEVFDNETVDNDRKRQLTEETFEATAEKSLNQDSAPPPSLSDTVVGQQPDQTSIELANSDQQQNGETNEDKEEEVLEEEEQKYSRQEPTNIPYDRLIVLEFEATCDDNPSNPASVQVTKENSEIIGNANYQSE